MRRFGKPAQDRHSIQVEINRQIYMDEKTFAIVQPGFDREDLKDLVRMLTEWNGRF